ncbi:MAG: flagellar basal body P-ring formation protein FlgA [Dechloromonas sp.]|nr:flagellar basal body P-ring formation protein FlgA [Dechloromonas sp.]
MIRYLAFLFFLISTTIGHAAETDLVVDTAERYVRQQTQGLPGKVQIKIGSLDVTRLPPCTAHEAFSPSGTRLSGKTHVGVRCLGPAIWSVLVPVQIAITGNYVTTARPLAAGQTISAGDLIVSTGDLTSMPTGILGDPQLAIGKTLRNSLGAGQPLRSDQLVAPLVIRQGQTVRIISVGPGFAVSSEGKAMNNAAEGQIAQVRMASGQTVSGVAKADGSVEISF